MPRPAPRARPPRCNPGVISLEHNINFGSNLVVPGVPPAEAEAEAETEAEAEAEAGAEAEPVGVTNDQGGSEGSRGVGDDGGGWCRFA